MGEIMERMRAGRPEEKAFRVNGKTYRVSIESHWTLAHLLRDRLLLTGTKIACDNGACGACTVLVEGETVLSCMALAAEYEGREIVTIEGLSDGARLHPLQEAWLDEHGAQCGFCAPGMLMTAKALLDRIPQPRLEDVREALSGNICRCGNYDHIVASVLRAARRMGGETDG
jgi:carbon-monoxide dehydrogenase small subunit